MVTIYMNLITIELDDLDSIEANIKNYNSKNITYMIKHSVAK